MGRQENDWIELRGVRVNNLKNIDVTLPLGTFICVSGVSGSGKSFTAKEEIVNLYGLGIHCHMKDIMAVKDLAFQAYRSVSQICTKSSQFIGQDKMKLLS